MKKEMLLALCAGFALTGIAFAQQPAAAPPPVDFSKVEIKTTDLGHKTYLLEGQGGNITVAIGDDGIIMVDGQFAPLHDKIKAAITALSPLPIKYLVNTHFHGDHVGGNGPFSKDGATTVATANVKTRLAAGTVNGLTGVRAPPVTGDGLPMQTYTGDALALEVKGRKAQLKHVAAAHTDGDTYVYFADANVISTGDIVSYGNRYPNIDVANGGNVKGMIAGVDIYLALANDQTKIVPGHGALLDKAGLMAYRANLVAARDAVAKLVADGKSEDEAVAAKPLAADIEGKFGASAEASANFVKLIYRSLKV